MTPNLPRVLCVDDEARVLEGLVLNLRRNFDVHTALGGEKGLQKLKADMHGFSTAAEAKAAADALVAQGNVAAAEAAKTAAKPAKNGGKGARR